MADYRQGSEARKYISYYHMTDLHNDQFLKESATYLLNCETSLSALLNGNIVKKDLLDIFITKFNRLLIIRVKTAKTLN